MHTHYHLHTIAVTFLTWNHDGTHPCTHELKTDPVRCNTDDAIEALDACTLASTIQCSIYANLFHAQENVRISATGLGLWWLVQPLSFILLSVLVYFSLSLFFQTTRKRESITSLRLHTTCMVVKVGGHVSLCTYSDLGTKPFITVHNFEYLTKPGLVWGREGRLVHAWGRASYSK